MFRRIPSKIIWNFPCYLGRRHLEACIISKLITFGTKLGQRWMDTTFEFHMYACEQTENIFCQGQVDSELSTRRISQFHNLPTQFNSLQASTVNIIKEKRFDNLAAMRLSQFSKSESNSPWAGTVDAIKASQGEVWQFVTGKGIGGQLSPRCSKQGCKGVRGQLAAPPASCSLLLEEPK